MWILDSDCANPISNEQAVRAGGVSYPGNWDKATIPGLQQVVMTPQPEGVLSLGNSIEICDGVPTRVWQTQPLPPPTPPSAAEINAPILAQLDEIDRKSIRALREGDMVRVAALEIQAEVLRSQLVR